MTMNLKPLAESIATHVAGVGDTGSKFGSDVKLDEVPNGFTQLITQHPRGEWGIREGQLLNIQPKYGSLHSVGQDNALPFSSALGRKDFVSMVHAVEDPAGYSAIGVAWDAAANQLGTKPVRDWGAFGPEGGEGGRNFTAHATYVRGNGDGTGVRLLDPRVGDTAGADARLQLDRAFGDYRTRNELVMGMPSGE